MAEVKIAGTYRVTVTEYDCGVQRVDPEDTRYFTTEAEAKAYADHWETGGSREIYWRCRIEKL